VREDTPAEEAGVRPATGTEVVAGQQVPTGGDVIVELDGVAVTTEAEVQSLIDAKRPGDTVSITVLRDGDRETVDVKLATRPR
jgi:S1-C subfamily serine protease